MFVPLSMDIPAGLWKTVEASEPMDTKAPAIPIAAAPCS
jgi:hypothetical protein